MLFTKRFWPGIADGSITLTFRRWKRHQVVAGHRYRTGGGIVHVDAVDIVSPTDVTEADAVAAGYESATALVVDLRPLPDLPLYRVVFHVVTDPDPREELAASSDLTVADVAEIDRRLDRLDASSSHGPWTREVLRAIATHPEVRAPDLAASFARETQPFKRDVRKLKNLGLTLSFRIGYRLSPRGEAYLTQRGGDGG